MDIAICIIDSDKSSLQFAGANNSLYLIRNNELFETKGDKMPVAIYERMPSFTPHVIKLQKGDSLYLFSDGYADQFGGEKGKKFMYKAFKQLLCRISDRSMPEQQNILEETITSWMGEYEQIDDMVVIGMRI
jgi:serine phosphatase RsbU (regulator of sigma subunit)